MKILYFTDPHFRDTNPVNRLDDFYQKQFDKMKDLVNIRETLKAADIVISGGDWFDNPTPSYELFNSVLNFILDLSAEVFSVCGSHDIYGYNMNTLNKSAIGSLIKVQAINLLNEEPITLDACVVKGFSARKKYSVKDFKLGIKTDKVKIIVAHDPIVTEPVIYDHMLVEDIAKETDADVILCGHIHAQFDITIKKTRFINPGPFTRQNINEAKIEPKVCVIDLDNPRIKYYHDIKSAGKDVFNIIDNKNDKEVNFDNFIESLKNISIEDINIIKEIEKIIEKMKIDKKVKDEIFKRLEVKHEG